MMFVLLFTLQDSQVSRNKFLKHVLAISRLGPRNSVSSIPHCEEPQIVHRFEVPDSLSIAEPAAPRLVCCLIVAVSSRPVCHLVEHGQNSRMVANAVEQLKIVCQC